MNDNQEQQSIESSEGAIPVRVVPKQQKRTLRALVFTRLAAITRSKPKLSDLKKFLVKPNKRLLMGAAVATVVIVGVFIINDRVRLAQPFVGSENGSIALLDAKPHMAITDGFSIRGTLKPQDDVSLYYIVSSEDKRALGAGNISFSDGSFSRNLAFDAKDHKGKKGELQVYLQDKDGRRVDGLTIDVMLR